MKLRWLLVALLSAALAVAAGCGGDGPDNPFEGSWVAKTGARITFTEDAWWDSDGDFGTYTFTGEDPVYTLTMDTDTSRFLRRGTFINDRALELCMVTSTGTVGFCLDLVLDKPTLH